ncbi:ewing's tumor-associated antigen 1 [Fundulus heteroclitus]|uniref:ewing's tumor-associated antigen 1 n=1 Tax=Fundulus heteroclitus TaxID=8078 RepID=UPI00165A9D6C|nr:ewing's tumor-associated antigen 1 [Fundulus heteroclitus]
MNGGRGRFDVPAAARTPRRNRLSRSLRQSQAGPAEVLESTRNQTEPDFKTPTRISRSKPGPGSDVASPHNESDLQQDIIWDATSPPPHRLGKRGKKPGAGPVNISEIVSRIAPKHGRPRVTEPALQQWIGDSAAIPCTPDPQAPRAKKKSPRPNGVEDLLRLAKQFDLNMFHQEDQNPDQNPQKNPDQNPQQNLDQNPQQNPDQNPDQNLLHSSSLDRRSQPLEDDLDFLFDGPTQKLSGTLSPARSQVRPASACGSASAVGRTAEPGPAQTGFEDDWENDDLLNDSLVLEMTQNPQSFLVPKLCSTQKPAGSVRTPGPVAPGQSGLGWVGPSVGTRIQKENLRPRAASGSSGPKIQQTGSGSRGGEQNRTRPGSMQAGKPGQTSSSNPEPRRSQNNPRTSGGGSAPAADLGSDVADFPDDDLDSLFSSEPEPGWGDPADDDLLCEMCDDLENQMLIQVLVRTEPATSQSPVLSSQRAVLQPTHRTWENRVPPTAAGSSLAAGVGAQVKQPMRFQHPQPAADAAFRTSQTRTTGSEPSAEPSAEPRPTKARLFTFKKPVSLVTMETGTGKCSAAEIELKKQQALERRRQRLQTVENRPGDSRPGFT